MSVPTKKLINTVEGCVDDSIDGFVAANPGVCRVGPHRIVVRKDLDDLKASGKVTILSGGGSGHEPMFPGFVGKGMLSSGAHGSVFAAPSSQIVHTALKVLGQGHKAGVLVLINNYTGDRLNFGIAIEHAQSEGMLVKMAVLGEDCAGCGNVSTGRRGLNGCILMFKIIGALAEKGKSLDELHATAEKVAKSMGTMGVCLSPCSLPGSPPLFTMGPEDMELGMGIHGEAGVKRGKLTDAKNVVRSIIDHMTNPDNPTHITFQKGQKVVMLLNNMGSTSEIEMNIVMKETLLYLKEIGLCVKRAYQGRYATSLDMAGISISILKLQDDWLECLDAEHNTFSWRQPVYVNTESGAGPDFSMLDKNEHKVKTQGQCAAISQGASEQLTKVLETICSALIQAESNLNQLDSLSGDGDCGSTLKSGAQAILSHLHAGELDVKSPSTLGQQLARISEETMGGTSGALYSLFLTAAAGALKDSCTATDWVAALQAGLAAVMTYGQANVGDRTMVDALMPACEVLKNEVGTRSVEEALRYAAEVAQARAQETAKLEAKAGRASYVSSDYLTQPDPGAVAVGIWLHALHSGMVMESM